MIKKNSTVFNINSKSSYDNDFRKIMRDLSNDAKKSDLITEINYIHRKQW